MKIIKLDNLTDIIILNLEKVWESSIRNTHSFLSEKNITDIKSILKDAFKSMDHILYIVHDESIVAFLGIIDKKIEMLFVEANTRNKGLGKLLLQTAIKDYHIKFVDVNEQNTQGVGFYNHMNFIIIDRSELDEQGNEFPILHMKLKD